MGPTASPSCGFWHGENTTYTGTPSHWVFQQPNLHVPNLSFWGFKIHRFKRVSTKEVSWLIWMLDWSQVMKFPMKFHFGYYFLGSFYHREIPQVKQWKLHRNFWRESGHSDDSDDVGNHHLPEKCWDHLGVLGPLEEDGNTIAQRVCLWRWLFPSQCLGQVRGKLGSGTFLAGVLCELAQDIQWIANSLVKIDISRTWPC